MNALDLEAWGISIDRLDQLEGAAQEKLRELRARSKPDRELEASLWSLLEWDCRTIRKLVDAGQLDQAGQAMLRARKRHDDAMSAAALAARESSDSNLKNKPRKSDDEILAVVKNPSFPLRKQQAFELEMSVRRLQERLRNIQSK